MNGLYGPRTDEVERFLFRLERLTSVQRLVVRTGASPDVRGTAEALRAADAAAVRHGRNAALDAAARAVRRSLELTRVRDSPELSPLARVAGTAVTLRDLITWPHFALLYGPFFAVIPLSRLKRQTYFGPNTAQVTRFLTKVERVTETEWHRVLAAHLQPSSGQVPLPDALKTHSESAQVEARVMAGRSWDRGVRGVSVAVTGRELAQHAAQRAITGLVVKDWISPECFAALYAPFAPVIQLEKLTVRQAIQRFLSMAARQLLGEMARRISQLGNRQ